MFELMDTFMIVFMLIFVSMFVFTIARGLSTWNKNNHSPRLSVPAVIVDKREHTTHYNHALGDGGYSTTSSTDYYVTFQFESNDRIELSVSGREYGLLVQGDEGILTFQGTRYLSFERQKIRY